jgi:hypothetical protein
VRIAVTARAAAIAAAIALSGCTGGTETGNPPFEAKLSYTAYSTRPETISVGGAGSVLTVSAAWLDLGDVGFVIGGTCAAPDAESLFAAGLGVGDHAAAKPASTRFTLNTGSYCEVDLPFISVPSALPDEAPPELADHSIMLQGTLANGTSFSVLSNTTTTTRLAPPAGDFTVRKESPNVLFAFDVAAWLGALDFSSANIQGGSITVSADQNPALLELFEARLGRGVSLYPDENGDGHVTSGATALAQGE